MERISSPVTRPFYWILPGLVWLGLLALCAVNIVSSLRTHEWAGAVALIGMLIVFAWYLTVFRFYDVHVRGDMLILTHPLQHIQVPLEQVTGIEAPWESYQRFPIAWLHWRDAHGVRRRVRFIASQAQAPELTQLKHRLPKNVLFVDGP
jgi:hypothetical protein